MAITESDIPEWFGATYAERGERYQRQQRVSELRRVDGNLRARCQGSQPQPYDVRVALEGDEYAGSTCSCPIGGGCKHVAAVLYEYVRRSGDVPESSPLDDRLAEMPHERLVELVSTYADRHPDFETWVEARLAAEGGNGTTVERADIRGRVEAAVARTADLQSYYRPATFEDLDDLRETADTHIEAGSPENAANILAPIAESLIEHYDWFDDSHGEVAGTIDRVASQLVEAFEVADAPSLRSTILRDLWEIWHWDSAFGGILFDTPFERAFFEAADAPERQTLADWARQALEKQGPPSEDDRYSSNWHRRRLGELVLDLEGESLPEEELVDLVERAALEQWWVRELLNRGGIERAKELTDKLSGLEQLNLVDGFVEIGRDDLAEDILLGLERDDDGRYQRRARQALIEFYTEREDWARALEFACEDFEDRPAREPLRQVERLARKADRWEELETELLNTLTDAAPEELIWYYLEDDDPDAAVAIWKGTDLHPFFDTTKFAEAVADSHPGIAVECFENAAETLIANRGRSNYREACRYISRMRDIYRDAGHEDIWERRRDQFLEDHSNLPAFQDEMDKARLT